MMGIYGRIQAALAIKQRHRFSARNIWCDRVSIQHHKFCDVALFWGLGETFPIISMSRMRQLHYTIVHAQKESLPLAA